MWRISFEGHTWTEDDLTINEAERVCELTGESWARLHPLTSPTHLKVLIAVLLERHDEKYDQTVERVGKMGVNELLECVGRHDDGHGKVEFEEYPPPTAGGTSTDT